MSLIDHLHRRIGTAAVSGALTDDFVAGGDSLTRVYVMN